MGDRRKESAATFSDCGITQIFLDDTFHKYVTKPVVTRWESISYGGLTKPTTKSHGIALLICFDFDDLGKSAYRSGAAYGLAYLDKYVYNLTDSNWYEYYDTHTGKYTLANCVLLSFGMM